MNALPRAARWYLVCIWGTAAALVAGALVRAQAAQVDLLFLAVALVAFVLADHFIVEYRTGDGKEIGMTISDSLVLFLAITAGAYGVLVVIAGSLITDLISKRGWIKGLFNAAQRAICFMALLAIFHAVSDPGGTPFAGPHGLAAFVLMAAAYHALNTILVATILAFAGGQPLLQVYVESFRRVHWVHFITLPFGAILAYIWLTNPWLIIPAAMPLVMAQRTFQTIADLQEQSRRNHELAHKATTLLEELKANQEALLRSSKLAALGTFAAGIGHDFNNLLTAILGNAQLGRMCDDLAEKEESLAVIEQACLRGKSITGGLLAFARRRETARRPCDLADLVAETLHLVQPEFTRNGISIEQRIEPTTPVVCDAGQIAQVLMNLLTNARDAMAERGGGRVVIALRQGDGVVELAVSDSGRGIPEALLPQIFQPFVTTKGATDGSATAGTGLGLAISHGIVQSHAGTIVVASVVGEGTTMTVRLPVSSAPADGAPEPFGALAVLETRAVG